MARVKQDCVLAPTLFSMVFSAMLADANSNNEEENSIQIKYRTDGSVFNLRRLQAKTKVKETSVSEFLFADDAALNAALEIKMQKNMDHFSEACNNFGLTISTAKTEVMYQPAPQKAYSEPTITVGNETLKVTDRFCYLGSTLSSSANIDAEVENRIAKASSTFGRLRKTVWEIRGIKTST